MMGSSSMVHRSSQGTGRRIDEPGSDAFLANQLPSGAVGLTGRVRRLAVLGARGVGKSALTIRLCEGTFPESYLPTIEDSYQTILRGRDNEMYTCEIIDTAGQDEFSPMGAQATIGVDGYVILYSVRDANSFDMAHYINDRLLTTLGSDQVARILVGNQIDHEADREVGREQGEAAASAMGAAFCECSAKSGTNIIEVFRMLLEEVDRIGAYDIEDDEDDEMEGLPPGERGLRPDSASDPDKRASLKTSPEKLRRDGAFNNSTRQWAPTANAAFTNWAERNEQTSSSSSVLLSRCFVQ